MENYNIQDWIYTAMFGLLSTLIIGNNIYHAIQAKIKNERTSFTLFIGSIFGAISLLTAPIQFFKWLVFIPALIDPGTSLVIYSILKTKYGSKN